MVSCKSVVIIILNFNGYRDTIECLSSISEVDYPLVKVIMIDNASTDGSVDKIFAWSQAKFNVQIFHDFELNSRSAIFPESSTETFSSSFPELTIINNSENLGFAAGCNQGIRLTRPFEFDYVWLLNNDTIIEPDALSIMIRYLERDSSCQVVTPQIRLHAQPDKIWNCGGELKWYGIRKYYYVHRPVAELPEKEVLDITFVTGCAPLIRSTMIQEEKIFSEKFFFGEEDFEFSMRMKRARKKIVCCLPSVIYHKVGSSIDNVSDEQKIGKAYIHYLNRFINLRDYFPMPFWHCWRVLYVLYIFLLLGKITKCNSRVRYSFIKKLLKDSSGMDGVDRNAFLTILHSNISYFKKQ